MKVGEIMATNPATCGPEAGLDEVALSMVECDCGMIPVVDEAGTPIGTVTDRDITCRAVAKGLNPFELRASDIMSTPCVTISRDADLDDCAILLEERQIRRVVVTDESGRCCGVVSLADIALSAPAEKAAEVVREVSQPTVEPSNIHLS